MRRLTIDEAAWLDTPRGHTLELEHGPTDRVPQVLRRLGADRFELVTLDVTLDLGRNVWELVAASPLAVEVWL